MVTMGMSMLGICVIGRVFRLTAPSTIRTTKSTNGGMGLRIDQAEMLRAISTSFRGSRVIADGHDPFAWPGEGCGTSDDLLAFNQSVQDFDTGTAFEAGFDVADFDDIVRRNLDVGTILAEEDGRQRHGDGWSPAKCKFTAGKSAGLQRRMVRKRDRDPAEPASFVYGRIDQLHTAVDRLADAGQPDLDVLAWHDLRERRFRNLGVEFDFTVADQPEQRLARRAGYCAQTGSAMRDSPGGRRLQFGSCDFQIYLAPLRLRKRFFSFGHAQILLRGGGFRGGDLGPGLTRQELHRRGRAGSNQCLRTF